ncbi:MAG TPA: DNA/RNA non-specific endonuclease [Pyrinomonadaceae bacterium]|nr:DNA/RNA non-specific endonuclease [Pyrinomonadaceae bacterium]
MRLPANKAARRKSGAAPAAAETAAAAAAKEPPDPRLTKALSKVRRNAAKLKKHDPAKDKADQAQDAAEPPEKEKYSRAQGNKVEEIKSEMESAEKKKPSVEEKPPQEKSFLQTLEEEIERVMPKKIEDADDFMNEGATKNLKGAVSGNIEAQKQQVTGPVKAAANNKPDESAVTPKPVVKPLPEALPKAAAEAVGARDAMPAPAPDEKVSLQSSKDEAERQFQENKITPKQLQKANDPRFTAVLQAKEDVDAHADAGPQQYRQLEQKTLVNAAGRAAAAERRDMGAMLGTHGQKGGDVKTRQGKAMEEDKAARQKVVTDIENMFTATKTAVDTKLATLESDVTKMFDEGAEKAVKSMRDEAERKKDDWKDDRYYWHGVMTRPDLWAYDKLRGIDEQPKIKRIYVEAAEQFTKDMKALVRVIAAFVEGRLKEAKDEVEKGRKAIHDYVENDLPKGLKDVGLAAEKEVSERFDELKQSIEDKKNDLASSLAQRYKDAHDKAGEAIKEMQAEDKGLVSAFLDKLREIIEILSNFRRRIMSMLRKAANAIDLIIADPIGFLGNLLSAVKRGVSQFVGRILVHLQEGFMAWLFGSLTAMGVAIPKDLSLPSILQLALEVLGLTYAKIRGKVAKVIGERNMSLLEAAWGAVETLLKGGPAALWEQIKEHFSNLKEMVVDAIKDWLISTIIQSAATKMAMMFNPVGAIIQAIMMIYRTVMFFIENIDRILDFVEAIIESVYNIATGAIGSAADWIEKALARTIPVIIAFLARLLGISGIADKIKGFILKTQTRVEKAIDKVIDKVVGGVKKLFGKDDSKPHAPVDGDLRAQEDFSIGKESHWLKGEYVGDKFVITMASGNAAAFAEKVEEIRKEWIPFRKEHPAGDLNAELKRIEGEGFNIIIKANAIRKRTGKSTERAKSLFVNQEIDKLAADLRDVCRRFDITKVEGVSNYQQPPAHAVSYGSPKSFGRATGASVKLSFNTRPFMRPTRPAVAVPGTHILAPSKVYQRGHLLAASLGGSNSDPLNFAPMSATTNTSRGGMQLREDALRKAVRADVYPPWIIHYSVKATYLNNEAEFESWLVKLGATPGAQRRLYQRAAAGAAISDAHIAAALAGGASPPKTLSYDSDWVREKLLHSFTPVRFTATVQVEQEPTDAKPLPASEPLDNHR